MVTTRDLSQSRSAHSMRSTQSAPPAYGAIEPPPPPYVVDEDLESQRWTTYVRREIAQRADSEGERTNVSTSTSLWSQVPLRHRSRLPHSERRKLSRFSKIVSGLIVAACCAVAISVAAWANVGDDSGCDDTSRHGYQGYGAGGVQHGGGDGAEYRYGGYHVDAYPWDRIRLGG